MTEQYPESKAAKTWTENGLTYSLVLHSEIAKAAGPQAPMLGIKPHWCGYVRLPERPVKEPGYSGILTYAPVHGGITFAEKQGDEMVYGFDCAHAGDSENPQCHNKAWLREQCELMARAVQLAAKYEDDYLLAEGDNDKRAKIIDAYIEDLGEPLEIQNNIGVMINFLAGDL